MQTGNRIGFVLLLSLTGACGPSIRTAVRYDTGAYDAKENRQEKDGLIVENKNVTELPASFYATAQACNGQGQLLVDESRAPVMQKVAFVGPGQLWYQVSITNNTEHVIRLSSAIFKLFDPAGNQIDYIAKDDLSANFLSTRQCPSSQTVLPQLKLIKMMDRSVELLPGSSFAGWLGFAPPSLSVPGGWKLAFYELPVAVNEAGAVTKTTRFEIRFTIKKFVDTYQRDNPFAAERLIDTKEATD